MSLSESDEKKLFEIIRREIGNNEQEKRELEAIKFAPGTLKSSLFKMNASLYKKYWKKATEKLQESGNQQNPSGSPSASSASSRLSRAPEPSSHHHSLHQTSSDIRQASSRPSIPIQKTTQRSYQEAAQPLLELQQASSGSNQAISGINRSLAASSPQGPSAPIMRSVPASVFHGTPNLQSEGMGQGPNSEYGGYSRGGPSIRPSSLMQVGHSRMVLKDSDLIGAGFVQGYAREFFKKELKPETAIDLFNGLDVFLRKLSKDLIQLTVAEKVILGHGSINSLVVQGPQESLQGASEVIERRRNEEGLLRKRVSLYPVYMNNSLMEEFKFQEEFKELSDCLEKKLIGRLPTADDGRAIKGGNNTKKTSDMVSSFCDFRDGERFGRG